MKEKYVINDTVLYTPEEHRLTPLGRRGKETLLNTPVNRCLLLLLQNPGDVVRQETLLAEVWEKHGQYVTMNTLYQNILLLRRGMREAGVIISAIKTIPKVGVKFTGKVQLVEEDDNTHAESELNIAAEDVSVNRDAKDEAATINSDVPVENVSNDEIALENVSRRSWISYLKENKGIRFFFPAACFIILASLFTIGPAESVLFFATHDKITTLDQCAVYTERENKSMNSIEIKNFMAGRNLQCNSGEFLYITRAPKDDYILVFFCRTASDGDIECSTRFNVASKSIGAAKSGVPTRGVVPKP
ncbi:MULTISPECIES: winged helix-turn-helix domain-containing protein [unclassified Serratia (in: enterobacteria)]|uniref:winged helix-turn-helix domain-containing protein n=1 Tax=unclassified Serratia (in: enterobacteria) TaxID=2647522 RepID=UPI0018A89A70|nr:MULTISPECIES: winged helix-turn-helix domain-containing protein [unclassified Serratia (in: enterobacteria)]